MYQISFLHRPVFEDFKKSPINGKLGGTNVTVRIVITKDGAIFQPPTPVRICAWLQTTPREQPRYLSPTSGKTDDLLWTRTAADQGSLTIVLRVTIKSLNLANYPRISLVGAALKIRADLPRLIPEKPSTMSISVAPTESIGDLHSTNPSESEEGGGEPSILRALLTQASFRTPIDVITIGVETLSVAVHLACYLSENIWEASALSQRAPWSLFLFKPSRIVVADEANEIITVEGEDMTTETWIQRCIKVNYIDQALRAGKPLHYAVRLSFQNLNSAGLGDGACGRAWSLIIAADDYALRESTREATANQIEAVRTSSIWHSVEKASPKLLLQINGPISENQMSLLDMVQSDGWKVVETLERAPIELQPAGPENFGVSVRYFLLENRRNTCDYIELVSIGASVENSPLKAKVGQVVDNNSGSVTADATESDDTRHEMKLGHLGYMQTTQPVIQAPNLRTIPNQIFLESVATRALGTQDQGKAKIYEALDSKPKTDPAVKRRGSPEELNQSGKKRLR